MDIVIANAGVQVEGCLVDGDAEGVARQMSVNVIGTTNTIVPFIHPW